MSAVSSHHERKQLEEDIERIKSALQSSEGSDWQLQVNVAESEDEDEDHEDDDVDGQSTVSRDDLGTTLSQGDVNEGEISRSRDEGLFKVPAVPSTSSGPEGPGSEVIQMSLALNRAYQEIVLENLESIQDMLEQNRTQQSEVQEALTKEMSEKGSKSSGHNKKRSVTSYGMPYFRDKYNLPPPPNEETKAMQASGEVSAFLRQPKQWSKKEKDKLKMAVEASILKQRLQPLIIKKELDLEKLEQAKDEAHEEEINERIQGLQQRIIQIRNNANAEEINEDEEKAIDWMKISTVDFDGQRSPRDCNLYWKYALQPSINTARWRADEDEKLASLVEEHGGRDWQKIAEELGTSRTAFQCVQRFQMKLNPCLQTGLWTTEEDVFLKEVVESVTTEGNTPWDQVAYYMEGRSNEQCQNRWRMLSNVVTKGRWTKEEDKLLLDGYTRFRNMWTKVQELVPGRSAQQCRERFMNTITIKRKTGTWTYREDKNLWLLASEHGQGRWAAIAAKMEGRSDNSCLQRYRVLERFMAVEEVILMLPKGPGILQKLLKLGLRELNMPRPQKKPPAKVDRLLKLNRTERAVIQKQLDLRMLDCNSSRNTKKVEQLKTKINIIKIQEQQLLRQKGAAKVKNESDTEREDAASEASHQQEIKEVLEDRKNGIIIPRCLLGRRGPKSALFLDGNAEKLKKVILMKLKRARKHMTGGPPRSTEGESESDDLPAVKKKRSRPKARRSKVMKTEVMDEDEEAEVVEEEPPVKLSTARGRPSGKQKSRQQVMLEKVNKEICSLLTDTSETKNIGRPKKYYAEDPPAMEKPNLPNTKVVERKVIKLLAAAMNIDYDGSVNHARKLCREERTDSPTKKKRLVEDLERFETSFGCDMNPQPATTASGKAGTKDPNISLQVLPRPALRGAEATRAYNLPPIPPTVATLRGFKGLLLGRRNLIWQLKQRQVRAAKSKSQSSSKEEDLGENEQQTNGVSTDIHDTNQDTSHDSEQFPDIPSASRYLDSFESRGGGDDPNRLSSPRGFLGSSPGVSTKIAPQPFSRSSSLNTPPLPTDIQRCTQSPFIRQLSTPKQSTSADSLSFPPESPIFSATPGTPASSRQTIQESLQTPTNAAVSTGNSVNSSISSPAVSKSITSSTPVGQRRSSQSQPKVLVLKGSNLTPSALTEILKSKGIIADPAKIKMQLLNKSDLAKKVINNSGLVSETLSSVKGKQDNRKKAMSMLRQTHDYQLLKARFRSLFLWPALMSTIQVNSDKLPNSGAEDDDDEGDSEEKELTGIEQTWEEKPLILAKNDLKKSKRNKNRRNRYPYSRGKRSRQLNTMKRDEKVVQVEKFRKARREGYTGSLELDAVDEAGPVSPAAEVDASSDGEAVAIKTEWIKAEVESAEEQEEPTISYMVVKRDEVDSDELEDMDSDTYVGEDYQHQVMDLSKHQNR